MYTSIVAAINNDIRARGARVVFASASAAYGGAIYALVRIVRIKTHCGHRRLGRSERRRSTAAIVVTADRWRCPDAGLSTTVERDQSPTVSGASVRPAPSRRPRTRLRTLGPTVRAVGNRPPTVHDPETDTVSVPRYSRRNTDTNCSYTPATRFYIRISSGYNFNHY